MIIHKTYRCPLTEYHCPLCGSVLAEYDIDIYLKLEYTPALSYTNKYCNYGIFNWNIFYNSGTDTPQRDATYTELRKFATALFDLRK